MAVAEELKDRQLALEAIEALVKCPLDGITVSQLIAWKRWLLEDEARSLGYAHRVRLAGIVRSARASRQARQRPSAQDGHGRAKAERRAKGLAPLRSALPSWLTSQAPTAGEKGLPTKPPRKGAPDGVA